MTSFSSSSQPSRKYRGFDRDDEEAFQQIDQRSENGSQRDDRSELGETEEEGSARSEHAYQPHYDDASQDESVKSSVKGGDCECFFSLLFPSSFVFQSPHTNVVPAADNESEDTITLEQVERAVARLQKLRFVPNKQTNDSNNAKLTFCCYIPSKKSRETVLHAIYVCNGEVKVAHDYLIKGPKCTLPPLFVVFDARPSPHKLLRFFL